MKPLPAQQPAAGRTSGEAIPSLPTTLAVSPAGFSKANRRTNSCSVQRVYPWLLSASTGVAALFCMMYITKPVISSAPSFSPMITTIPSLASNGNSASQSRLMPSSDRLPGEKTATPVDGKPLPTDPRRALPGVSSASAFEETNLRIQHVLTADAPGGHVNRIDIDVPVLYQSRNLRWTAAEVAEARDLLVRLMTYQEKSQMLRAEGVELLDQWNRLVASSIPGTDLRADSPTLPENQEDAADAPRSSDLITTESIQLQSSGK